MSRISSRVVRETQVVSEFHRTTPGGAAFFSIKTLRKAWNLAETPYPKKTRRLPTILSREEVAQLLHAARTPGERILRQNVAM
jgi:site-specific recombinase XerD